jgi:predicted glycoside hydrolase/deacetylase ChbG (UPF0249 family)
MLIRVLRKGGFFDYVKPTYLDQLIKQNSAVCFHRKEGLVMVGQDPTRDSKNNQYFGLERRQEE